jgi:hypothetical protein
MTETNKDITQPNQMGFKRRASLKGVEFLRKSEDCREEVTKNVTQKQPQKGTKQSHKKDTIKCSLLFCDLCVPQR